MADEPTVDVAGEATLFARIQTVDQARIEGDNVIAGTVTTLTTRVDTNEATLVATQTVTNATALRYSVTGTINGVTGGFTFSGIQRNNGGAVFNFEVNSNMSIHGNLLVTGTITNSKLADLIISTQPIPAPNSGPRPNPPTAFSAN